MRKLLRIFLPTLTLCAVSVPEPVLASGEVTFTKVLDSETPIPGEDDTFGRLAGMQDGEPLVAMDPHGNLALAAGGRVFAVIDGQLHYTTESRGSLKQVAIEGGRVAFGVHDTFDAGIFLWEPGGDPVEIAGKNTLVPGGDGCVFETEEEGVSDWRFSLDGDAVLFFGKGSPEAGTDCDSLEGTFLWWNGSIEHLSSSRGASIDAGFVAFHTDGVVYAREARLRAGSSERATRFLDDRPSSML